MKFPRFNLSIIKSNIHVFLSYFTETILIQISQLVLIIFAFKYLSNDLFYAIGMIQIIQSLGIVYYDSGIYTYVKIGENKAFRIRNYWLSISIFRFVLFLFLVIIAIISYVLFFGEQLNTYIYVLFPYIFLTFAVGFLTTIIESDGRLAKLSYYRSIITSIISIISAFLIYSFKLDILYIAQLYLIQLSVLILIYRFFKVEFKFKLPKFKGLISLNSKISFTRNNIWMGFFIDNFFLLLNYMTNQSSSQIASFYKLDKYLKVFFGFLLGLYQRTFFYIQIQNEIKFSWKKAILIFLLISVCGFFPLWFLIERLHDFSFVLFIKLATFYLVIYSIIFLSFVNTVNNSKSMKLILNIFLLSSLIIYTLIIFYFK